MPGICEARVEPNGPRQSRGGLLDASYIGEGPTKCSGEVRIVGVFRCIALDRFKSGAHLVAACEEAPARKRRFRITSVFFDALKQRAGLQTVLMINRHVEPLQQAIARLFSGIGWLHFGPRRG